jgi:hypothetical protein
MISEKSRVQAVAAKISAARELARRLAEEKQAAVAAAKADADTDRMKRSTEEAAAQAAAQVRRWSWRFPCLFGAVLETGGMYSMAPAAA